jgi:fumarate reductase subunit D
MSFVTVFTAGTMAFVLLVPVLMVLALSTVTPLRRAVADGAVDGAQVPDREPAPQLSPVAA